MTKQILLLCGILSSMMYTAMNLFIPAGFERYSYVRHTVSELSAIGAPTRSLWVSLAIIYIILFGLFAWGVRIAFRGNVKLRIVSTIMFAYAVINMYWPPMHLRGDERTLTDTLHLIWAGITVLLMILMMAIGAQSLGKTFRWYTIISIGANVVFGFLTSREAPNITINAPTPWIGLWERINIAVFMLWIGVLSFSLLRREFVSTDQHQGEHQRATDLPV